MQLGKVLADLFTPQELEQQVGDAVNMDIGNVTQDSRSVAPGCLFISIPCSDQVQYVEQAIAKGCVAVLGDANSVQHAASLSTKVVSIAYDQPRFALAMIARNFYQFQPECCVAVTGTNGKSSTVHFVRQIWQQLGYNSASLGTLGLQHECEEGATDLVMPNLTTPDALSLHKALQKLADTGVDHIAFEASSHGLDQYRLHGVKLKAAAFTNLTQDHLDYHSDMGSYFAAKASLFDEVLAPDGVAVLNRDDTMFADLLKICEHRRLRVVSYSCQGVADIQARNIIAESNGLVFDLQIGDQLFNNLEINMLGKFQVENVLASIGLAVATGEDHAKVVDCLSSLSSPIGRMELAGVTGGGAAVYVDFSHTPEALRRALESARQHVTKSLHVVFGCGGDRDQEKRPYMGQVAADLADYVYVTDDNPRTEDPENIRQMVLAGCPNAENIPDRQVAITTAVAALKEGDILIIAGKGHENVQILSDRTIPFLDKAVVQSILSNQHTLQQGG